MDNFRELNKILGLWEVDFDRLGINHNTKFHSVTDLDLNESNLHLNEYTIRNVIWRPSFFIGFHKIIGFKDTFWLNCRRHRIMSRCIFLWHLSTSFILIKQEYFGSGRYCFKTRIFSVQLYILSYSLSAYKQNINRSIFFIEFIDKTIWCIWCEYRLGLESFLISVLIETTLLEIKFLAASR